MVRSNVEQIVGILTGILQYCTTKVKDEEFLRRSRYKTIAIYGLENSAKLFVHEVKELPVTIKNCIDRQKKEFDNIKVADILDRLETGIVL